jgi:hypothetical protein
LSKDVMRLNSIDLRDAAEYASSLRRPGGDPEFLVISPQRDARGELEMRHVKERPAPTPNQVVIPCDTATVQPVRPPVVSLEIRARGMKASEQLAERYDAVFWSEAAVEKFLFPYYASKYQWQAAQALRALSKVFYGFVPGEDEAPAGVNDVDVPFAMAHLPRSEYVPLDEAGVDGAAGGDLVVLFRDREGKVSHRPFSEYLSKA